MEIETKIRVKELDEIKNKLIALGAKFENEVIQIDDYFRQKGKEKETQRPGSFILRIRKEGQKSKLTFKALTNVTGAWIEHETGIENPNEMETILNKIGFTKVFTIKKKRIKGKLNEFEICLDDVENLGKFVEFEVIAHNAEEGKNKINELLKKLNLENAEIEHRGYATIVSQKVGIKFEGTGG